MTVLWIILIWVALAAVTGVLIGRAIRLADVQQERARRRPPFLPPGSGPPVPNLARDAPRQPPVGPGDGD